jgi:hypothetical protein
MLDWLRVVSFRFARCGYRLILLIPVMFTVESGALSDSATSENDPVAIPSRPR